MPTTKTTEAGNRPAAAPKRGTLTQRGARLLSWKTVLVQSLGRELHSLHLQQQERAFMATTHGLAYVAWKSETHVVH
ncbi:MAG: hypothetical protein ACFCUW_06860 [Kiloniellaceae bacterium]